MSSDGQLLTRKWKILIVLAFIMSLIDGTSRLRREFDPKLQDHEARIAKLESKVEALEDAVGIEASTPVDGATQP